MRLGYRSFKSAVLAIALILPAVGCNYRLAGDPGAAQTPFQTVGGIRLTSVLETFTPESVGATGTLAAAGTPSPSPPPASATVSSVRVSPTPCTDRAAFIGDVTIRDNTLVLPGMAFVKIWRLRNTGTCIWDKSYGITFIGGERMKASSPVDLTTMVLPGSTVDLPVDMAAPSQPGSYQGFWKLIGRDGSYFGIGADAEVAFWVKIIVPAVPTPTGVLAPTLTPTTTATPMPTQEAVAAGTASLSRNMSLDLDTGEIDPPSGSDISLLEATPGALALVPTGGAQMSRYGPPPDPPPPSRCQALSLTDAPIPLSSLSVQGLVCYRTAGGLYGYLRVKNLDGGLGIEFLTWGP